MASSSSTLSLTDHLYIFFSAAYPYEHTSSHFAAFFLTSIVMVFAAYVVYHNRQKVMYCHYYSSSVPQNKPILGRYKINLLSPREKLLFSSNIQCTSGKALFGIYPKSPQQTYKTYKMSQIELRRLKGVFRCTRSRNLHRDADVS